MYSIYSISEGHEPVCIHDDSVADRSIKVLDPKLKLGDSNAGSLEFKLAPNNLAYGGYTVTETKAKGIIDADGGETDITSDLEQGSINQNGEEIESTTALRAPANGEFYTRGTASAVRFTARGASVAYNTITVSNGLAPNANEAKGLFVEGYINHISGNDEGSGYSIRYFGSIDITSTSVINVTAKRVNVGTSLRYKLYFYDANGQYLGATTRMACDTPYTKSDPFSTAKTVRICILGETDQDTLNTNQIASGTCYIYLDGITWYKWDATSSTPSSDSFDHLHSGFIEVSGESVRLYHRFSLKPVVTLQRIIDESTAETPTMEFENGNITTANGYIGKDNSDSTHVRLGFRIPETLYFSYYGSTRAFFSIDIETSAEKEIKISKIVSASNSERAQVYGSSDATEGVYANSYGGPYMWLVVSYADGSAIDKDDITKFDITFKPSKTDGEAFIYATTHLYGYDANTGKYTYYRSSTVIVPNNSACERIYDTNDDISLTYSQGGPTLYATHIVVDYTIKLGYGTVSTYFRGHSASDIVDSLECGISTPIEYAVVQYDSNGTCVNVGSYKRLNSEEFVPTCGKYRVVVKFIDDSPITTSSLDSMKMRKTKLDTEVTIKKLDLVGRLTSTIKVYRSTYGHSKTSNGVFNVMSVKDITDTMEQGWINPDGSDLSSSHGLRSKEIYPISLTQDDYISINSSLRLYETTESSESSSTYRKPSEYTVHFYLNGVHLGFVDNTPSDSDISLAGLSYLENGCDGIKICTRAVDHSEPTIMDNLDFVKLYSTADAVKGVDINQVGTEIDSEYTVTTNELTLTNTVNDPTRLKCSIQINAQSRQGIAFVWGVAMYSTAHAYLGMQRWIGENDVFTEVLRGTKYIRVILKYKSLSNSPYGIELPPNDISNLTVTTNILARPRDEVEIWEGRVLSENVDFNNCRVIYCEGALAYLNDTRQPPRVFPNTSFRNYISKLLETHNSKVVEARRFALGTTWEPTKKKGEEWQPQDPDEDITRHVTNFETTLELLNGLVSDYGGHLRIRKSGSIRYLDWLEDYPTKSDQVINFGKNLLDFTRKYDMSNMCTAVYPTGQVLVEAKSSAVGDPVDKTGGKWVEYQNTLLYQDEYDSKIYMNSGSGLAGYLTVIATVEPSKMVNGKLEEKSYYFSGRLHGGFVAFWVTDDQGNMYNGGIELAGDDRPDTGFVDYVDHKITMPAGANKIWMCSFGSAIPLALKNETKETEGLDKVLTIDEVNTDKDSNGKVWHVKGSPYISNPDTIDKYGWIEHRLDLQNLKDKNALYEAAKKYLQSDQFEDITLEVTAIDLNSLGVNEESINILDKVRCVSEPHGLDKEFPVTELEIPLNDPKNQKFKLGSKNEVNLTGQNASTNTELLQKIEKAPSTESVIRTALESAAASIANATTGSFINYRYDENGHMTELIISENEPTDSSDPTTITSGSTWRWNDNGLAHSNGGYNADQFAADANIAITKDGRVIANEILGQFILGYTLGGSQLVIGENLPASKTAVQAKLPDPSKSAITVLAPSGQENIDYYMDLHNSKLECGTLQSGIRTLYGRINGAIRVGYDQKVFVIESQGGVIDLNANEIWVGVGDDGFENVSKAYTGTFEDANGNTFYVRNGLILDPDPN